ncbi:39618_t:CDS:2, partial [Gigaspora margarita]
LFAFDNATAYTAFAENALLSSKMNLFSIIKEDYIIYDNKTKSDINLHGQPKEL